ncbi:MAG: hypothetical protein U9N59_12855, partial [Campylobacterota bacterium]|nr:hypothetical protein [Campylobacterota bacterium]
MEYQNKDFDDVIKYITLLKDESILLKKQNQELKDRPKLKTDLKIWGIVNAAKFVGLAPNTFRKILKDTNRLKINIDYLSDNLNHYLFSKSSLENLQKENYDNKRNNSRRQTIQIST